MILNKDYHEIFTQNEQSGITGFGETPVYSWMWKKQPASSIIEWSFDWMWSFEAYEIYTDFMWVNIWDKIVVGGVNYYVKWKEDFTGIIRSYTKCLCNTKFD
jgi:hypothetical protein